MTSIFTENFHTHKSTQDFFTRMHPSEEKQGTVTKEMSDIGKQPSTLLTHGGEGDKISLNRRDVYGIALVHSPFVCQRATEKATKHAGLCRDSQARRYKWIHQSASVCSINLDGCKFTTQSHVISSRVSLYQKIPGTAPLQFCLDYITHSNAASEKRNKCG